MKVLDWKGNEIKEGDEICFIEVKSGGIFTNVHFWIPFTGERIPIDMPPEKDCWDVGEYYKVKKIGDCLYYTVDFGENKATIPLCDNFVDDKRFILAIKGESDFLIKES